MKRGYVMTLRRFTVAVALVVAVILTSIPWNAALAVTTLHAPGASQGSARHAAASSATTTLSPMAVWQVPWSGGAQEMGYLLVAGSAVVMVDGGMPNSAPAIAARLGTRVPTAWIVTHAHTDHVGALVSLLKTRPDLKPGVVYASLPTPEWVAANEPTRPESLTDLTGLLAALKTANVPVVDVKLGQRITIGSIRLDFLGVRNPEITVNAVNNSSMVVKASGTNRDVLFLGDLGPEGGRKLLAGPTAGLLPTSTVQMSHHGQNGVDRDVYAAIRPRICLWPTPKWLWDNDSGAGPNSGQWTTTTTMRWMIELGVEKHYLSWRNDQLP